MPKIVIIQADVNLDDYYQAMLHHVDQKYHNYQTTFPTYPTTEAELGEQETNAAYAKHAGDGKKLSGHPEKWIA